MLLSLALVLGLEVSSRTNFESLALALALKVKSLALRVKSRAPQSHTNCDMKAVKAPRDCQLDSFDSFEPLTLFNKVFIA